MVRRWVRVVVVLLALMLPSASSPAAEDPARFDLRIDLPSSRFAVFAQAQGLFTIGYPDNWQATAADDGEAASMAPPGGIVTASDGRQVMVYGVIVDHYAPLAGYTGRKGDAPSSGPADEEPRRGSLEEKTDDLVRQIVAANPHLRARADGGRREALDGWPSHRIVLSGRSPVTGLDERLTLAARELPDGHLIYALCVVPDVGYDSMPRTFASMLRTLRVAGDLPHHGAATLAGSRP